MRNFSAVPAQQYIGTPYTRPLQYAGIAGQGVPLNFNWLAYGASTTVPNLCAIVDLRSPPVSQRIPSIRSVYIDNMGSDTPIYVYFPDTQYSVVCQPNAAGWFKVYTGNLVLWVIGLGFLTGSIPSTYIIVTNLSVENAIDIEISQSVALWKASPVITRGTSLYNSTFGTPALGDQTIQYNNAVSGTGVVQTGLWGTPLTSGFLYLTHVDFSLANIFGPLGASNDIAFVLESTGIAGILYSLAWGVSGAHAANPLDMQKLLNFSNMQIKLDATQTWRLRVTALTATMTCNLLSAFDFTTNPS